MSNQHRTLNVKTIKASLKYPKHALRLHSSLHVSEMPSFWTQRWGNPPSLYLIPGSTFVPAPSHLHQGVPFFLFLLLLAAPRDAGVLSLEKLKTKRNKAFHSPLSYKYLLYNYCRTLAWVERRREISYGFFLSLLYNLSHMNSQEDGIQDYK